MSPEIIQVAVKASTRARSACFLFETVRNEIAACGRIINRSVVYLNSVVVPENVNWMELANGIHQS
jgi:hypothetical protein